MVSWSQVLGVFDLYICNELLVKVYEGTSYFVTRSDVSVT